MNEQPGGEIILYQRGDAPAIDVRLDGDTVWLSQQQLADLFQTSRTNVVEHIANIYAEGELTADPTCREFRQVRKEGTRQVTRTLMFYNLDLIISLGYRVKSSTATQFRIWATERLRDHKVASTATIGFGDQVNRSHAVFGCVHTYLVNQFANRARLHGELRQNLVELGYVS